MKISLRTPCAWEGVEEILIDHYPFIVGRERSNDGPLPLAFVSRQHCRFTLEDNIVFVRDLESYNGTYVNGRRISQATPVRNGDEISVSPLAFHVAFVRNAEETRPDRLSRPTRKMFSPGMKKNPEPPTCEKRTRPDGDVSAQLGVARRLA